MGRSRLATRRPYLAAQVREQLCVRLSKPPRRKVSDDRVRFLNQFEPLPAEIEYLKPLQTEEARLRAIIEHDCPEHMEELDIALNTGMRRSEHICGSTGHVSIWREKTCSFREARMGNPATCR
jgi:hypothetical protein